MPSFSYVPVAKAKEIKAGDFLELVLCSIKSEQCPPVLEFEAMKVGKEEVKGTFSLTLKKLGFSKESGYTIASEGSVIDNDMVEPKGNSENCDEPVPRNKAYVYIGIPENKQASIEVTVFP